MNEQPWTVRPMTVADFEASLALWRATAGVGLGESDTPERLAAFLARNPGASAVALDAAGALVGTVLCGDDGRRGCLYHLAVVPAVRRRGIGRALVAHALRHLAARGIEKCNLLVFGDHTAGLDYWRKLGWTARGDLVFMQTRPEVTAPGPCAGRTC